MLLMIIAASASLQDAPVGLNRPASPADWSAAREALDRNLLDYPSARFRDVRADELRVCGLVNTKNRMGAYGGFTPFAVFLSKEREPAVYLANQDGGDVMIETLCGPIFPEQADQAANITFRQGRP